MSRHRQSVTPPGSEGTEPAHDPWLGRTIAQKYRLVERLGNGGMGTVYRCEHTLLSGHSFAVKLLHAEFSMNPEVRARFLREGEILLGLAHPSIVSVRDLGLTVGGQIYLCLDYCEGVGLSDILRRRGRLAPADALRITEQILDAMVVAHDAGIIHRDLKPENIIIGAGAGEELKVSILDFGIAGLSDGEGGDLTQGMILGTPRYMSPEQAWGNPVDSRSDIYSVGLILHELIAGQPAVDAPSTRGLIAKQRSADVAPIGKSIANHPWREAIERLLADVLVEDPDQRLATAGEFRDRVRAVLELESEDSTGSARQPWLAAALLLCFGGAVVAGFFFRAEIAAALQRVQSGSGGATTVERPTPPRESAPTPRAGTPKPSPEAPRAHGCTICGYEATQPGICPVDGVRLTPTND